MNESKASFWTLISSGHYSRSSVNEAQKLWLTWLRVLSGYKKEALKPLPWLTTAAESQRAVTTNVNDAVLLYPPAAVIIILEFATFALLPRERFSVTLPLPGAEIRFEDHDAVTPLGNDELDSVIWELNPATPAVVTVRLLFPPGGSATDAGLSAKVNPETFTTTFAVRVTPPPLALMVSV